MMKKTINLNRIWSLTKVLCKEYFEKLPIFNKDNTNQSRIFKACSIIAVLGLAFLSLKIIEFLQKTGEPQIFLNVYMLILSIIVIFQQILASTNVYYFSKDLEYILPFPIKPVELLIARFNLLISVSYVSMILFAFVPLLIYGIMAATSLLYYPGMVIALITFPIIFGLIISTIMLFLMQLTKIIKNKDLFQIIVTVIFVVIITVLEGQAINSILSNSEIISQIVEGEKINLIAVIDDKIQQVNKFLLTVNPSVKLLIGENIFSNILELLKIIFVNTIGAIIFIFIGKKLYLKNILKNIQMVNSSKIKKGKIKHKYKKTSAKKAYIKNEFKEIIKTPTFLMQCVFPIILVVIAIAFIMIAMYPSIMEIMKEESVAEGLQELKFDITAFVTIVIVMQIIFTFSSLSITAISRKGKNAFFIKYIPISLYKQFLYLNIPQIFLNMLISILVLGIVKYFIPGITILQMFAIFITTMILNIINSFLMLIIDIKKPNLDWDNETDAIKRNQNKLFQYVLTIIIILLLIYFAQVFENIKINLNLSMVLISTILFLVLFIINLIVKKNINKIFNKII